jgi:titin
MRSQPERLGSPSSARRRLRRVGGALLATTLGAGTFLMGMAPALADPPTAPDAPDAPTLTTTAGHVTVTFSAPADDGGSAITGYTAACASSDGGLSNSNSGPDETPIVVDPLSTGKTYTCTVVATNAYGDSAASDPSDPIVVLAAVPGTPDQPVATADHNTISLALDDPADNGSPITEYDADCTSSDGGVAGTATSDSLPIVVEDLSPGHTYSCTVTATNAVGTSAASPATDDVAIDAVPPSTPDKPSVHPSDGTITVTFFDPTDDGGSAVSSYDVDCVSSDGGTEGTATDSASPIDVSGLDNGNTYTCTVAATNDAGTSDPSVASDAVIVGSPTVAGGASVTPAHNGAYVTYGDSVDDSGDDVTGYSADCVSSDGGTEGTGSSVDVPVYVGGLDDGNTYSCTLTATNSRGDGPASDPSDDFEPGPIPGTPDAPTNIKPGDGHAIVTFDAPDDSGDPITSYDVDCVSSDGGTEGTATDVASPIDVTGLDNTNTYACMVRATNSTGTGLWSPMSEDFVVGPGAPDAPEITSITRGSNSVIVDFTTPDDHDSAITAYTVTCDSDDGGAEATATDVGAPIEVDSLTNSHYYSCTVVATNDVGDSPASDASDQFLAAAEPDAPHIAHLALGDNSVTVTVNAPADNGEPIDNYEVTCTSDDDQIVGDDATTTILVEGLTNGSTYTCAVTATNVMGTSDPSADSAPFIAATYPDVPTLTGVTRGNNSGIVAFDDAPWDGSAEIHSFTVTCVSSDGGTTRSNYGTASPITVGYLTNAKTYSCSVHATNAIGNSQESDSSDDFVSAATPRPPTITARTLGPNSVSVVFRSAGDGGDPIQQYTVTCTSSNGGTTKTNTDTDSPIVVSALSNSKAYTCTVVATNDVGDSAASRASTGFIAATYPNAPTITGVTRTSNGGSVAFSVPANNGSTITKYTVMCASSDGGATKSAFAAKSPIVVGALTNGKTYTCVVNALNAIGTGADSVASASFTAAAKANAPTITGLTRSSGAVSVAFNAPNDNSAAITSYKATCTSANGGVARSASAASSPVRVSTLTSAKTYTCTVVAINAIGTSAASAVSSSFVAAAIPTAPQISGYTRTNNAVTVAFSGAVANGDAITGYTATCTSSNGGTTQSTSGATSPLTVSTLTNAKSYICKVLATNTMGNSLWSAGSSFVAAAVPDAPSITNVSSAHGTATLTFTPGANNGAAITRYNASCASSDGGATRVGTNTRSPLNVLSLSVGKTYTCTLTATNAIGTGAASVPSATFTA